MMLGFVPTMGALHEGHLSLVHQARRACDRVVVSVFVNPTQFGPQEDFEQYPRNAARDRALLEAEGVEVWFPSLEEIYPEGVANVIRLSPPEALTHILCGKDRPDHFSGVATVVDRLLRYVQPTHLYLGQKDYQQTRVVQWVLDRLFPTVALSVGETVRDVDGLALSSRNAYLSDAERSMALQLPRALQAVKEAFEAGERDVFALEMRLRAALQRSGLEVSYAEVRDASTLASLHRLQDSQSAVALAAVRVGRTRLIDNVLLSPLQK